MKIAMIGTGYVGLTTGACLAKVGHDVICVDNDESKIDTLQKGGVPIFEPGLKEILEETVTAGRLSFTTDIGQAVRQSQVAFIAVGTPTRDTGEPDLTTWDVFREHGYDELAAEKQLSLIDLNETELVELNDPAGKVFPTFMMPSVLMESFLISAATLKAHSLARVTLSMKNMIGAAPPAYYQRGGYWRKSAFHHQMQSSIFEMNRYPHIPPGR